MTSNGKPPSTRKSSPRRHCLGRHRSWRVGVGAAVLGSDDETEAIHQRARNATWLGLGEPLWSGKVYGRYVIYYVETGFMATDGELNSEGTLVKYTHWNPDGTVVNQDWLPPGELEKQFKEGPPWWWGVTDQTEPSIPAWMKDDELWATALEANKW